MSPLGFRDRAIRKAGITVWKLIASSSASLHQDPRARLGRVGGAEGVRTAHSLAAVLPIAVTSKLGVSGAEMEHMPFYLRIFRLLYSWEHHLRRRVRPTFRGRSGSWTGSDGRRHLRRPPFQSSGLQVEHGSGMDAMSGSDAIRSDDGCDACSCR